VTDQSVASATLRRPRPGGRSKDVLDRIYARTLDILREKGLAGVTFNDIAGAADVARSTLYRRWTDRNELVLDAMLASVTREIVPSSLGALDSDLGSVLEQMGVYLSSPLGHAVLIAALELSTTDSPAGQRQIALWRERLEAFESLFDRAKQRGERAEDFDGPVAFAMAAGAVYYRVIIHHERVDADWIARIMAQWRRLPGR
jgi:AcrR family transcriptional regulator